MIEEKVDLEATIKLKNKVFLLCRLFMKQRIMKAIMSIKIIQKLFKMGNTIIKINFNLKKYNLPAYNEL